MQQDKMMRQMRAKQKSISICFTLLFQKRSIFKLSLVRLIVLKLCEACYSLQGCLLFAIYILNSFNPKKFNMSVMKSRLFLSREQATSSRQDLSISRTDQQDCSVSSVKSNSELRDLISILKEFVEVSKQKVEGEGRQEGGSELEPRDRPVIVNLPQELSHGALERFMTKLCGEVWSKAFHYYSTNQMSFENTKIYCSQQILKNLARLSEKYPLTAHHFAVIDRHLQGSVLEYMLQKYPMTLSQEINRNLNNAIRQIDDTDNPAYDYLCNSNFTFKYRQTGEYNDLIMRTINQAINRIQARSDSQSVYERFENNMTLLFDSVSNYEWMHKGSNGKEGKEGKLESKGDLKAEEEQSEGLWLLTLTLNNSLQRKMTMDGETLRSEYIKIKEKEKSSYEEKVKQYTHYKVNKKLPQSARLFTQEQISSHRLKIQSPQILRILTKWCTELEKKLEGPDCFQHFLRGVSLEKSTNLSLMLSEVRDSLGELIREQKARIKQELAELAGNNFSMQSELLRQKLEGAEFSQVDRYQRISAQLSIDIVNNLHSYIIAYLNRLIHGLLAVWRRFQKLPGVEELELTGGAGIISFQVMDLVRCKCASRQKEILRIYHQLLRMCEVKPNMSLVRVVNRLRRGTNDILINVMYRDVLCEIQLAVTNKQNTFLEYSNSFNHYLYELKRSVFGPLTQLAGIWKNLDARFNIYKKNKDVSGNLEDSLGNSVRILGAHGCGGRSGFVAYNRPFICSQCSQHYFHNKFVKKHIKCSACDFWLCARCQIKDSDCLELLTAAFNNQEVVRKCKKLDKNAEILPSYGMCIYIESQETIVEPFRKYTSDKSTEKIMGIKNKCIYQIYDTSTQRQRSKFISKFLIFEMEEEFASRSIKISNQAARHYLIEEKFKHTLAKNKDVVCLNNQGLTDQQLHQLTTIANHQQRSRIKGVQLMGNKLTNAAALQQFPDVVRVELSKNRISDFSGFSHLRDLQRVALSDNGLKNFPQELCTIRSLRELTINQNAIKSIPEALRQCTGLISLHFSSNKLTELPSFLFQLPHLAYLSATSNFIKEIPQAIQLARKLKHLSIQNNYIKGIPREVEFLVDLERLNLSYNKIAQLPYLGSLRSLKHLNLRQNSLTNIDELLTTPMNIRQMDLSYNSIRTVGSFDNHYLLKFLNLSHNQITNFPVFTRTCVNLKHLLLSNNKMTVMGTLEHLLSLQELNLSNNALQNVHVSLSRLENLIILHLDGNQLNSFSNIYMEQIMKIFLQRNRITEMRGLHMRHLEELDVSENQLSCFEANFLPKIKKINLNINQLHELDLVSYIKLSVLQAARNQLRHVPNLHPSNQLKFLNLERNCIQEIPRPMLTSSHINTLNLSSNLIRVIPRELQNLATLKQKSLFLHKNPLELVECPHFISNKCGYDITNDINASRAEAPPQVRLEGQMELLFSQTLPIMPP